MKLEPDAEFFVYFSDLEERERERERERIFFKVTGRNKTSRKNISCVEKER